MERVDHELAHGEVPGTEANKLREADAKPDAISVVSDGETSTSEGPTHSGQVPATVIEQSSGSTGPHSEEFKDRRQADATPDIVLDPQGEGKSSDSEAEGSGTVF